MKNKERDREILPRRIHTWTDILGTKENVRTGMVKRERP